MTRDVLVVGAGAAGWSACEALRLMDKDSRLTVVSEEGPATCLRVLLTEFIAGRRGESQLVWADASRYRGLGADLIVGSAVAIDPDAHRVRLADDRTLHYDALLLATGAKPVAPTGIPLNGVDIIGLRTLEDAKCVRAALLSGGRVAIFGGGPVGVKLTIALVEAGAHPTLVVSSGHILSQVADADAAQLVHSRLEQAGADIMLNTSAAAAVRNGERLVAVTLEDGSSIECDLIVFCKGVESRYELLEGLARIGWGGLVVAETQETTLPGVYGAGDVAVCHDVAWDELRVNAIWPQAVEQGKVAGQNLARTRSNDSLVDKRSPASRVHRAGPSVSRNAFSALGLPFCSMGVACSSALAGLSHEVDRGSERLRHLVFKNGRLIGATLVGDVSQAGALHARIRKEACRTVDLTRVSSLRG